MQQKNYLYMLFVHVNITSYNIMLLLVKFIIL